MALRLQQSCLRLSCHDYLQVCNDSFPNRLKFKPKKIIIWNYILRNIITIGLTTVFAIEEMHMAHIDPLDTHEFLSREELEKFRSLLLEEQEKILQKSQQMMKAGNIELDKNEMLDEVDLASVTTEQNLTFKLLDRDRKLLSEIQHALRKIDTGDYGYCEGTGDPIPKRRLEVRPWCRHSVKYKEQLERMKKSGRGVGDEDEM